MPKKLRKIAMGHMVCMHVCKVASCITDTQLETYESNASTNPSKTRNPKMKSGSWGSLGRVLGELGESWEEFEGSCGKSGGILYY